MNDLLTELPFGLPGRIYRSPMPFGYFDPDQQIMDLYQKAGIDVVVMLVSDEEAFAKTGRDLRREYQKAGLQVVSLPIPDFGIPTVERLRAELTSVNLHAQNGLNVAVHCNAGIGRTGLFMACLARKILGLSGDQAAVWVRQYIEHAIENDDQLELVTGLTLDG